MKKDYVITVGGAPGPCYFTWPSDDDEPSLQTTSDIELAARFEDFVEARRELRKCVDLHPERQFRLDVTDQINRS